LSPSASGATWSGLNWGGIPFEWMVGYYGSDISLWPSASTHLAAGGPTVFQVFLSGSSPLDSTTWLRTKLVGTPEGFFLTWNSQPGLIYQVQISTNLVGWINLGDPRFAAGAEDSLFVGGGSAAFYQVLLSR
jgi:hypothetical protein